MVDNQIQPPPQASASLPTRIVGWTKANPFVAFIIAALPIAGSIVGLVSGLPGAWQAALRMSGRPTCASYAPVYHYATGAFTRTGAKSWHEKNTSDQFDFEEVRRTPDFILLHNLTRRVDPRWPTMLVRLPPCGGVAQWTYENPEFWVDLFQVWS